MGRSSWKRLPVDRWLVEVAKKVQKATGSGQQKQAIKIKQRAHPVTPEFVGLNVEIHNGKEFLKVNIKPEMVGMKFGEFAPTRKYPKFPHHKYPSNFPAWGWPGHRNMR